MRDLKEIDGDWLIINGKPIEIAGEDVVIQRIDRRLNTPQGSLFYDAEFGIRVRNHINGPVDGNRTDKILNELDEDIEKDNGVKVSESTRKTAGSLKIETKITLLSSGREINRVLS